MYTESQIVAAVSPRRAFLLKRPRAREIIAMVAEASDVSATLMFSDLRDRWIVKPRHIAMRLCREHTGQSIMILAREFKRDHTTIIAAVRRAQHWIGTDPEMARVYADVKAQLCLTGNDNAD